MRLVNINNINGDETLGRAIHDIDGRRLLNAGVSLKPSIIQKLYEKGISSVYIDDNISEGIEIDEILSSEIKIHTKNVIREEMKSLSMNRSMDYSKLSEAVDTILEEVTSRKVDLISVKDIRLQDEETFAHSVNVCLMSIALATKLSIPVSKIKSIAMGALLHDMGKALLPTSLLNKTKPLSEEEDDEMKKHPLIGYNLIKDNLGTTATTKVAVLMHHEHIDGSGYPMCLSGDKIHYSARIITVCDEFDSTVNNTNNNNALNTTDAVEYLIGASGHTFDKSIVDQFLKIVPVYDAGSIVLLSNGILGIVTKNNSVNLTRPIVRALYNPKTGERFDKIKLIDLKTELSVKIIREVDINIDAIIKDKVRI